MGIVQLSPTLLVPHMLTFKAGTCCVLLGYAWMGLLLTAVKSITVGRPIPTGNQCWTMFLNTTNFKGHVACYTPATWSRISRQHPPAVARGVDTRSGLITRGPNELKTVSIFVSQPATAAMFAKIPPLQFPADKAGGSSPYHNLSHSSKGASYQPVH